MVGNPTSFKDSGYVSQWDGKNCNATRFVQFNDVLLPSIQMLGERMYRSVDLVHEDNEMCMRRNLIGSDHGDCKSSNGKGLSLTLSSHIPPDRPIASFSCGRTDLHVNEAGCSSISREEADEIHGSFMKQMRNGNSFCGSEDRDGRLFTSAMSQCHSSTTSNELASFNTILMNSRYLKSAQHLLEEVVSVGRGVEFESQKQLMKETSRVRTMSSGWGAESWKQTMNLDKKNLLLNEGECSSNDIHDTRIRIMNLVALLDEVDSRYEQYCRRMEEVVSSFELLAGIGAAKSYTTLTLQAMSRHFCNLRDAIITQINAARRCLSKDLPRVQGGLLKLSLRDQSFQNNRESLQQLGMIQIQQAWRPLRGLPENAVFILRTWLFEHFLHPYPNDSEKVMLASQTGLTRNQVSNWFINARVRLWKPMIEDMYREEIAEPPTDSNSSSDNISIT